MSSIRFGRGREYHFLRREDIRARWDLQSAVAFLNGFRADAVAMARIRRELLGIAGGSTIQGKMTDEQVIQTVARKLVSGELLLVLPQRVDLALGLIAEPPPPPPPPERKSTPKEEVFDDEPTFEPSHDGVAQAAVLIAAAANAFPFCEECAKHAAETAPVKPPPRQEVKVSGPVKDDPLLAPTFSPKFDPVAQAAVLTNAAVDGVPFCEECAKAAAKAPPPPPPVEEKVPVTAGPVPEDHTAPPTLDQKVDAVAQAAVLTEAATDGTPFCEECAKLAEQTPPPDSEEEEKAPTAGPAPDSTPPVPTLDTKMDPGAQAAALTQAADEGIPFCEECAKQAAMETVTQ